MSNPTKIDSASLSPLTDELIESGSDLSRYMTNPRPAPSVELEERAEKQINRTS